MEPTYQDQLAFHLTGRRSARLGGFGLAHRPALLARYSDLSELRYDFPLVINRNETPENTIMSLSGLVDGAIREMPEGPDRDRIARHAHRLEKQLRRELSQNGPGDFATMWHSAADLIAGNDDTVRESAMTLWREFGADGDLVDVDARLPARVVTAAWKAVQRVKADQFRARAERLLHRLRGILEAELAGSAAGRTPERLRAGIGTSFAGSFDFDVLARVLSDAKPDGTLSSTRRERIRSLVEVLENQRFVPLGPDPDAAFGFFFEHCSDAISAYNERRTAAIGLLRAVAVAELEAAGEYRESVHDPLFEDFGANGLAVSELARLPDYLVAVRAEALDAEETARIVEILAAGLPFSVLVETGDVLRPSAVAEGHVALGLQARQFANTAIALSDVFVLQASAARLFAKREALLRGLAYDGPALFSVFSGVSGHSGDVPAYLIAAAASESRVFPSLVFDPSAGDDWASRLSIDDNPSPEDDWPVRRFLYEDRELQAHFDSLPFTAAEFLALDQRFSGHFALAPSDEWSDAMVNFAEAGVAVRFDERIPYVQVVDGDLNLARAVGDARVLDEVRRCRAMWHSLQELAGIHNSHAERILAEERKRAAPLPEPETAPVGGAPAPVLTAPAGGTAPTAVSDDPYIETSRCTSCNECTHANPRMFVYNENRQAYIADPDAGTFRQLVEAAEGCQIGIIHPGKPRNPKEPGLDDLLARAETFL